MSVPTDSISFAQGDRLDTVEMRPDTLQLFRFSAVTWNSHRIHFDLEWARHEGLPGLVVHSHLHAANGLRAVTTNLPAGWRVTAFDYRVVRPAVAGETLTAGATVTAAGDDEVVFDVVETNAAGEACMTGTAVARPAGAAPS